MELLPHLDAGSGNPLMLLHGFGMDARTWAGQVRALEHRCRVLVPDLPGFGPGGLEVGQASPSEELFQLLEAKRVGPVHLVGLSLGGAVAVDFALAHPAAIRSLVLIDPLLLGERLGIESWPSCVERAKQGDVPGARQAWLGSEPFARVLANPETRTIARQMVEDYKGGHWRGTFKMVWRQPAPRPLLSTVQCPALVLVGERDLPSFQAMAKIYAANLPAARLEELAGVGHLAPLEAPERVNRLLLDFLESAGACAAPLPSSARLTFRTWTRQDGSLALKVWGDARVTSFVLAQPFNQAQVQERLRQEIERQTRHGMQYNPMFLRATGELVGCCGLRPRPSPAGILELGFLLRPEYWGQGLATEAAQAAAAHAFDVLGAAALFAGHHPANTGSRHVLLKLGFRQTHVEPYPPTGLEHPSYLLSKSDFRRTMP